MKKTHFLNLEFHPGDFCWTIIADEQKKEAFAAKLMIVRVIHAIDLLGEPEEGKIPEFVKTTFYLLSNNMTVEKPLRTQEEAESIIRKEMGVIQMPGNRN